jgi:glutamine amidotransferase
MIVIIDYGMGNTGSLANMIQKAGGRAVVSACRDDIEKASKLVLPGVGYFDQAVKNLHDLDLFSLIDTRVTIDRVPILAICLGAQLVTERSEEGELPGFGWVRGRTVRFSFPPNTRLKIPHMGWNEITIKKEHLVFHGMYENPCFYFVHSYHIVCDRPEDVLATAVHGYEFCAAVQRDNIVATQFHPEKSHKYGLKLISNFVEMADA